MLVVILDFDRVTGAHGGTGKRDVLLVARLGIDTSIGSARGGARCRSIRAGSERSGAIASMRRHENLGGLSMAGPCVRAKRRAATGLPAGSSGRRPWLR